MASDDEDNVHENDDDDESEGGTQIGFDAEVATLEGTEDIINVPAGTNYVPEGDEDIVSTANDKPEEGLENPSDDSPKIRRSS